MKKFLKLLVAVLALVLAVGALSACDSNAVNRADYNIPDEYTKIKIFNGTYSFGDAEIQAAMSDDESKFYIQYLCFDEDQVLQGTVSNGKCTVTYDRLGFVSGRPQQIYDDALASSEPWRTLK